jgi:DNA (cytosine-5)-methyltransferase 1
MSSLQLRVAPDRDAPEGLSALQVVQLGSSSEVAVAKLMTGSTQGLCAIDLFAGAGGTTLALKRAGFRVPVAVEIDPLRASTLAANHPDTKVLGLPATVGDVERVTGRDIRDAGKVARRGVDLLVGCPPCQGFSIQGNRNPRDGRNRLFEDLLRLASEILPRAVVVENVPGMATLSGGRFFSSLMSGLEGIGFDTVLWRLRASELGIPQDRERLFVIATRGSRTPIAPSTVSPPTVWEAIADLPSVPFSSLADRGRPVPYARGPASRYAACLRGRRRTVFAVERTRHAHYLERRFAALAWGEVDEKTRHRRLDPDRPAPTLTAGSRMRTACRPVHPFENRVLTVREAARLASFPDSYAFSPQIAVAWSEIGNAVPPLMASSVFKSVAASLSNV